jgi:hypothetical protein
LPRFGGKRLASGKRTLASAALNVKDALSRALRSMDKVLQL